jgi:hypothetical protein
LALINSQEGMLGKKKKSWYQNYLKFQQIEFKTFPILRRDNRNHWDISIISSIKNFKKKTSVVIKYCQTSEIFELGLLDSFFPPKSWLFWHIAIVGTIFIISPYKKRTDFHLLHRSARDLMPIITYYCMCHS